MRTGGTKVLRLPSLPPSQGPAQSEFRCQGGAGIHARGKDNASRTGIQLSTLTVFAPSITAWVMSPASESELLYRY